MRLVLGILLAGGRVQAADFSQEQAGRFAKLALDCVHQEYPNKIAHAMASDSDARPPRELTPAFYGCYDWHSSVHGHWLLVRLSRLFPKAPFAEAARAAVARSLTRRNIEREVKYLSAPGRNTFERPYGLAWLLQLGAELREWTDPGAREWAAALRPLEELAVARVSAWLPKLSYPVRTGEHSNTAFAMGLMLDYARIAGNGEFRKLLESRARDYYLKDRNCPAAYEPSGEDFLSPCLAEADAVRRILPQAEYVRWLDAFLPELPFEATRVTDVTDGKLYHLAGLNLSRAWMMEGIVSKLPAASPRRAGFEARIAKLREAGLASITGDHYEGGHWLGSFAVYLVSRRGIE
ncbi:MAG: DUF2891 domain-containing protein [Bryobacterales bacterium]|nr:DUF2891 domain-containing protein [Bryobacterales bacterium]